MAGLVMDPRIEALWTDRLQSVLTGSVFGDLRHFEMLACDAATEVRTLDRHPLGYVPRVVIDVASRRLLSTAAYFGPGTVLLVGQFGPRLVIGPCVPDGGEHYLAALKGAETYASALGRLIGGGDGYVRVLSFSPDRLKGNLAS